MTLIFGKNRRGQDIALPHVELRQHMAIFGNTGSGKTALAIGVAEQVISKNIPTILVDIKGDMGNICIQPNSLALQNRMKFTIYTPGATHGTPISLFNDIQKPHKRRAAVTQLLKLVGDKNWKNPLQSRSNVFIQKLLNVMDQNKETADILSIITGLQDPPFETIGALTINDAFPPASRQALSIKLNNLLAAPSFELWQEGQGLDLDSMLAIRNDGHTNVSIYSVAHLPGEEQDFALAVLFDAVEAWMHKQPGTKDLRALLVVDECVDILPPYPKNPVTKKPLLHMLKQGRAYGMGLLLATQNPMDIDYKALSNCQTWAVGRLQMANDRRRVLEALASNTVHDRSQLAAVLSGLSSRQFLMCRPKSQAAFRSRDVTADLIGPLTTREITAMIRNRANCDLQPYVDTFGAV
jgi:hypothetical protein